MPPRTPNLRMNPSRPIAPSAFTTMPLSAIASRDDSQDALIRALHERVAQLERIVTQLNSRISVNTANELVIQSDGALFIQAQGSLQISAGSTAQLNAAMLQISAQMTTTSGVFQCDTVIANSVISATYSPGAGNVW